MLEELKNAARKVQGERELRSLMVDCRRLMSERGEANSVAIARQLLARYAELSEERRHAFFERLARDFSPDPAAA